MKINNFGPLNPNPYKQNINKQVTSEKSISNTDKVEISSKAKNLQQTSPVAAERQEKIEALKQQVQSGSYKVNPQEVAKGIYNFYFQK